MRQFRTGPLLAIVGVGCATALSSAGDSAQRRAKSHARSRAVQPQLALDDVALGALCVTAGELAGARVQVPMFRAVAPGHGGDAASIRFVVREPLGQTRALASGSRRRQVGLKLRAKDGCNLVYVMWRLDPKPKLEVSIKRNPGAHESRDCGARGYRRLAPADVGKPPALEDGAEHELHAEIIGRTLVAWIDKRVIWRGELPADAHELTGPAGLRSDNLAFELASLAVDARGGSDVAPRCRGLPDSPSETERRTTRK